MSDRSECRDNGVDTRRVLIGSWTRVQIIPSGIRRSVQIDVSVPILNNRQKIFDWLVATRSAARTSGLARHAQQRGARVFRENGRCCNCSGNRNEQANSAMEFHFHSSLEWNYARCEFASACLKHAFRAEINASTPRDEKRNCKCFP
jgi:hypothetical protein